MPLVSTSRNATRPGARPGRVATRVLLLLAAAGPALAQPEVASGGYWRDATGSGHYRVTVLGSAEGSGVRVDWVGDGERGVVASTAIRELGEGGPWQVANAELRPEGEMTLLFLTARAAGGGEQRLITVALGAPGVAERR